MGTVSGDRCPGGARFYGYERFCQIVAEHVRVNDLTLPIAHVPGHSMQVDWAGTQMQLTDPITRESTRVSVFVASLPFSGMVFAYGCLDEKQPAWLDAHRRAFEYFGGVTQVVIPDNASTASNQISRTERGYQMVCVRGEVHLEGEHHGDHGYQSGARGASSPAEGAR